MKVIDIIKVCRGNVKFILDGEGPMLNSFDFLQLYCPGGVIQKEVATVTFDPDGCGGVICEISTEFVDDDLLD